MRLVSCYIAHFGKIKDFSYQFNEGFNPILEENGWGKTTFSVFIKAMFYGMEYSPNTKKKLMERKHYLPWDGSLCGGNIVFCVKDRTYRIERSFGKTDKEDFFALYDQTTGLESQDYSQDIGQELFKVDRDSFEKSVYVPQQALATAMTDSLNAKMGDLTAAKNDISNFDNAYKALKDAKAEYTRNSKVNPGKLYAIKNEINACREDYEKLPGIEEGYEAQSRLMEAKQKKLQELTDQKNILVEQIQLQSQREQELGAYRTYKENLKKEEATLEELDNFFAAGIPDGEELSLLEQTERDMALQEQNLRTLEDSRSPVTAAMAEAFADKIPDDSQFALWNNTATKLSELRAKASHAKLSEDSAKLLSDLKYFFDKLLPTDEQLSKVEKAATQITGLNALIDQTRDRLRELKAEYAAEAKLKKQKGGNTFTIVLAVLAILFALSGIVFSRYMVSRDGLIITLGFFILAVASIVGMIFLNKRHKRQETDQANEYEEEIQTVEEELQDYCSQVEELKRLCDSFLSHFLLTRADTLQENVYEIRRKLDQYKHLMEEEKAHQSLEDETTDQLADLQLELYTQLQPFAAAYNINLYDMGGEYNFLAQLKKDADKYTRYLEEEKLIARHKESIEIMNGQIQAFLSRYPVKADAQISEQLHEISDKASHYRAIADRIQALKKNIEDFEAAHAIDQEVKSVDDLQSQQVELDQQIVELNRQIIQEKENMSKNADEIERLSDISEQLERLEATEQEYKAQANLLEMTADLLQRSKESFLSRYMAPLQQGLHKYLKLIEPEDKSLEYDPEDFELDMDLNIKLSYQGASKKADYLSTGYQDLLALCSRLALVDLLYSDEKPILILDDPFTNMDQDKIEKALEIVKTIAKDRQTIYFTCHESRI